MKNLLFSACTTLVFLCSLHPLLSQNIYPLADGLKMQGSIYAIEQDPDHGRVYVGGYFTAIGDMKTSSIAYLENGEWHTLASGVEGAVYALKYVDGNLYVGGYFETASGVEVNHIARWDGTAWHPLGDGTNGYGSVLAIEWFQGKLYATGHFTKVGNVENKGVAVWDGNTWTDSGLDSPLHAKGLLVVQDTLWAYGSAYQGLGGLHHVASYMVNGSWAELPELQDSSIYTALSFVRFQNQYYIQTVYNKILKWNGNIWIDFLLPQSITSLEGMFVYDNDIWVITDSAFSGNLHFVRLTGGLLDIGKIPNDYNNSQVNVTKQMGSDLWVGGTFRELDSQPILSLAKYNGNAWASPGYIGGSGYNDAWLNASGYCAEPNSLIVGGRFEFAGNVYSPNIAKWDGQDWQTMGKGFNGIVSGVKEFNGNLYACGNFTKSGNTPIKNIAKWDGTAWQPIGSGADKRVRGFLELNGDLYAWGDFTQLNGNPVTALARLNGSTWEQVPGPWENDMYSTIYWLTEWQGNLVASIDFDMPVMVNTTTYGWSYMGSEYLSEGHLYNYDDELYLTQDYVGPDGWGTGAFRWNGNEWESSGLYDHEGFGFARFTEMDGQFYCTVTNGGLWRYDGSDTWTYLSYFQPYVAAPLGDHRYLVTGFFPSISTDNSITRREFNHVGILDFVPPQVEIFANKTEICKHQYVFFGAETSALYLDYQWHFPGGTPEYSSESRPIVQYTEPGTYTVTLVASNGGGADTVVFASQITVIDDPSCFTASQEAAAQHPFIEAFPNPASDYLQCVVHGVAYGEMRIVNAAGQTFEVASTKSQGNDGVTLDTAALPPGIYFLLFQTGKGVLSQKFIKI
ncbi:MAG: T9SS type A sorting domain-containing protein [Bacteroidetes bacterium]|nr:T9SS type A sorting domain-containing protein [Bacteroidota bacterium]